MIVDNIIINKGYLVTFKYTNGSQGFLASDDSSGGYWYFSDRIDERLVKDTPLKAYKMLGTAKKEMKTYYKHEKVDFSTMCVVEYNITLTPISDSMEDMKRKEALDKLTIEERALLGLKLCPQ